MQLSNCQSRTVVAGVFEHVWERSKTRIEVTMLLVTVAALFLVCLPPQAVSQQCRSDVTDEIRQSVREQLRRGQNGTIPTVAVNCGQVCLVAKCGCMDLLYCKVYDSFITSSSPLLCGCYVIECIIFQIKPCNLCPMGIKYR